MQSSDTKGLITQAPNNDLSTFLLLAETTISIETRPPYMHNQNLLLKFFQKQLKQFFFFF